jgi:hypothetical protein
MARLTTELSPDRVRELIEFVAVAGTLRNEQSSACAPAESPAASNSRFGFFDDEALPASSPAQAA